MAKVTTLKSPGLKTLGSRLLLAVDAAQVESGPVLKFSIQAAIFRKAFKTGALFRSVEVRLETIGRVHRLIAFTRIFYGGFIEYGTGLRGAASNVEKLPDGWHYGTSPGITARLPFKTGRDEALPGIRAIYDKHLALWKLGAY